MIAPMRNPAPPSARACGLSNALACRVLDGLVPSYQIGGALVKCAPAAQGCDEVASGTGPAA